MRGEATGPLVPLTAGIELMVDTGIICELMYVVRFGIEAPMVRRLGTEYILEEMADNVNDIVGLKKNDLRERTRKREKGGEINKIKAHEPLLCWWGQLEWINTIRRTLSVLESRISIEYTEI